MSLVEDQRKLQYILVLSLIAMQAKGGYGSVEVERTRHLLRLLLFIMGQEFPTLELHGLCMRDFEGHIDSVDKLSMIHIELARDEVLVSSVSRSGYKVSQSLQRYLKGFKELLPHWSEEDWSSLEKACQKAHSTYRESDERPEEALRTLKEEYSTPAT